MSEMFGNGTAAAAGPRQQQPPQPQRNVQQVNNNGSAQQQQILERQNQVQFSNIKTTLSDHPAINKGMTDGLF